MPVKPLLQLLQPSLQTIILDVKPTLDVGHWRVIGLLLMACYAWLGWLLLLARSLTLKPCMRLMDPPRGAHSRMLHVFIISFMFCRSLLHRPHHHIGSVRTQQLSSTTHHPTGQHAAH